MLTLIYKLKIFKITKFQKVIKKFMTFKLQIFLMKFQKKYNHDLDLFQLGL